MIRAALNSTNTENKCVKLLVLCNKASKSAQKIGINGKEEYDTQMNNLQHIIM
jgi:hypothetical protein